MPETWPSLLRGLPRKQEDNSVRGKGWGLDLDKVLIRSLAEQSLVLGPLEGA